jgi:hypothetical protein
MMWLLKTGDSGPCLTILNSDIEPHQFLPQARIMSNVHKKNAAPHSVLGIRIQEFCWIQISIRKRNSDLDTNVALNPGIVFSFKGTVSLYFLPTFFLIKLSP